MAVTLAAFAAIQVAVPLWLRPHLIPPLRATSVLSPAALANNSVSLNTGRMTVFTTADMPGAWIYSSQAVTPVGQVFTGPAGQACRTGSARACTAWLSRQHPGSWWFTSPPAGTGPSSGTRP